MIHLRSCFKLSALTLLGSQALVASTAFAAGFAINEISPSLQGSAMAGSAAASNDVSAMFINPAVLSDLKQNQVYIGGTEIFPHVKMTSASAIHTVNVPGIPPTNITASVLGTTSQQSVARPAFVPDGYFGYRINDHIVAGLSLVAPFGLVTKYYDNSVVRFAAINSSLKTMNLNPAVSFKINEKWSVGVGFQAQHVEAVFSNFNGPYTGIAPIDSFIAANNATYLTASGWGYGFTVGGVYLPDSKTRVGLGYRSMISNQVSGNGQQNVSPGPVVPAPSQAFLFNAQTAVGGAIKTPAALNLSATRDINDWTVKASLQMTFWDTFNHLSIYMPNAFATNSTIQTQWSNVWFAALGADYRWNSDWTFRGGVAYDQTPTSNLRRDPRIPDSDRYFLALGASYLMSKHLSFDGSYEHLFSPNQTVNVTQASGMSSTSTVPLEVNRVNAKYHSSVDIIAVALRYSF